MKALLPPGWPRPKGYSNAISARGRIIVTAGLVGWDAQERFVAADLAGQFRQILENLRLVLAEDGAGPEHIVRMTWYVTDVAEYRAGLNEIGSAWRKLIGRHFPAMAVVQVGALVEPQAKIEIETMAIVPGSMTAHIDTFIRDRLPPADQLPEFRFDLPELQYPETFNAAVELIDRRDQDALALVNDAGRWSYGEMSDLSDRIARLLNEEEGLVPGHRVLLRGPNTMMLFAAWLGILKAGGIVATMPMLRGGEVATLLARVQVSHAIVDSRWLEDYRAGAAEAGTVRLLLTYDGDAGTGALERRLSEVTPGFVPVQTRRDDVALVAFTSGTTGRPKGCVHYHRDVVASADSFARYVLEPQPGDRWACSAPIAFTFGLGMLLIFPWRFGGTAVTIEAPGPKPLLDAIQRHKVTTLATAPTAYKAMLGAIGDHDISTLRTCVSAGEHLPASTWQAWHDATGLRIVDDIGATEMMHVFDSASGDDIRPGATGKAVPGYVATVLDEEDRPMTAGTGRLAVKGPTGCRYFDDARQQDYVINGWNVTGDTYRRDEDGYFWYLARSDDMIISSGYNIAAPEVENALYAHPAVQECAVIGVACAERGQKVKAFVVLAEGHAPGEMLAVELQKHVKAVIAPYKYPREVEFVEALPKTATGKLQRFALRQPNAAQ